MWLKLEENRTVGQFFEGLNAIPLFMQNINLSFDFLGDEMPPNRVKILHPTGPSGLFKFVSNGNHPYTGSLRGTDYGILRISEVHAIKEDVDASTSAGLKFLRDGVDAGNMFTLHAFNGHPETRNVLREDIDYNTHVDLTTNECVLQTAHAKLSQVSKFIGNMSVKNLSDYDQFGTREENPKWPFMMRLIPNNPCN